MYDETKGKIIVNALKKHPGYNDNVFERVKGKMARQTFFTHRDILVNDKKIVTEKVGRYKWLYLPEDEDLFLKELGKKGKIRDSIDLNLKMKHAKDIIKEVIQPWIKQLSSKSYCKKLPYGSYFDYLNPEKDRYILEDELPVEKENLFLDLKNHIKEEFNSPVDELVTFKNNVIIFREKEKSIIKEIESVIRSHFRLRKKDFIPCWVTRKMLEILFKKYENDSEKELTIGPSDFRSQVKIEEENNIVVYSVIPPLQDIFKINKRIGSSERRSEILKELEMAVSINKFAKKIDKTHDEEIRRRMDKKIMELPEKIDKISNIRNEIKDLIKTKEELIRTINKIEISLKKYKDLKVYPGKCEYL